MTLCGAGVAGRGMALCGMGVVGFPGGPVLASVGVVDRWAAELLAAAPGVHHSVACGCCVVSVWVVCGGMAGIGVGARCGCVVVASVGGGGAGCGSVAGGGWGSGLY